MIFFVMGLPVLYGLLQHILVRRMKKTTRKYLWVLGANFLLLAAIMLLWQVRLEAAPAPQPVLRGYFTNVKIKDDPVPVPHADYLKDFTKRGDVINFKGQWTLLNLWATWCAPCVTELPSLQKMADNYKKRGLRVVAISLDDMVNVDELKDAMARHKLDNIAIAHNWDDKRAVGTAFWSDGLPATFLIDPKGRVFATYVGDADWTSPNATAFLDSLLVTKKAKAGTK